MLLMMKKIINLTILLALLSICDSLKKFARFVRMEQALPVHQDIWRKGNRVNEHHQHKVVFAVKQRNVRQLESVLFELSDPRHESYGKHWSREKVANFTANLKATQEIQSFLIRHNITIRSTTLYGEYITAIAPVSCWEEILDTKFYEFHYLDHQNHTSNVNVRMQPKIARTLKYSLPASLAKYVTTVFNTIHFPAGEHIRSSSILVSQGSKNPHLLAGTTNPAFINSFYRINSNTGDSRASQSVYETNGLYFSPADLNQFQRQFNLPQQAVSNVIGGQSSDSVCKSNVELCAEPNIDLQYLMGISQVTPTTHWYVGDDSNEVDAFVKWITDVADSSNPPLVHSFSYTADEATVSASSYNQFNLEAMKLGVQGVTIVVASGDDGVAGNRARNDAGRCGYNPSFPATSPYVLTVGGTQGPESGSTEVALAGNTNGGVATSGGGFSTKFSAPSFQSSAISTYFSRVLSSSSQRPASGYSASGRGYPDVSLEALNYEFIVGGNLVQVKERSFNHLA
jgi:tripeptidyl-peptidase-1